MNEAANIQTEALRSHRVSTETLAAKKQAPHIRFGLRHRTDGERKAHQARREHIDAAKTQATIKNVREEIVGLQTLPKEDVTHIKPLKTESVQAQPPTSKEPKSASERQPTYSFTTADKKAYNLNLPTNATLDEVRTALQAQGASGLATYLDRNVYFPNAISMDVLQEVAQTFNKRKLHEMRKAQSANNPMDTTTYRRKRDGKEFTLRVPKHATAYELTRALQLATGDETIGKGGFYTFPGEPTVAETLKGLLHADLSDLSDSVKDIWKAIKKSIRQYNKSLKDEANTK